MITSSDNDGSDSVTTVRPEELTRAADKTSTAVSLGGELGLPSMSGLHSKVNPEPPIPLNRAPLGASGLYSGGTWKVLIDGGLGNEGVFISGANSILDNPCFGVSHVLGMCSGAETCQPAPPSLTGLPRTPYTRCANIYASSSSGLYQIRTDACGFPCNSWTNCLPSRRRENAFLATRSTYPLRESWASALSFWACAVFCCSFSNSTCLARDSAVARSKSALSLKLADSTLPARSLASCASGLLAIQYFAPARWKNLRLVSQSRGARFLSLQYCPKFAFPLALWRFQMFEKK